MTSNQASVWTPAILTPISGHTKSVSELIIAAEGQTTFTLTKFLYAVGTGALDVHLNGALLNEDVDWEETTDTSFTLKGIVAVAGDKVTAQGHVGITGNVATSSVGGSYLSNYVAVRAYTEEATILYAQGKVSRNDRGEKYFQLSTGKVAGYYVDDDNSILVPDGGDGGEAWLATSVTLVGTAISLDVPVSSIASSYDKSTPLDSKSYLHDVGTELTWSLPTDLGATEVLVSFSAGALTTNLGAYVLQLTPSKATVIVDTYADVLVLLASVTRSTTIVSLNWEAGDKLRNNWQIVAGAPNLLLVSDNFVTFPEEVFGTLSIDCPEYRVVLAEGVEVSWARVDSAVAGKAGLGTQDTYGRYDPDLHYNALGDQYVQSKWLKDLPAFFVTEEDFDTGISRDVVSHIIVPANPPNVIGQHYIDVAAKTVRLSVGTQVLADWKLFP